MPTLKLAFTYRKFPKLIKYGTLFTVFTVVYFANHAWQSSMGRKAIENSGLVHYSLEQALALAKQENKQVLANLSAIWCPSCRKLNNQVLSQPHVQDDINASFVYARIEYDTAEGEDFMERYRVRGFPRILVLDSVGEKLHILPLTFESEEFRLALQKITSK